MTIKKYDWKNFCFKYINIPTNISIAAYQTEEQLFLEEMKPEHKKPMRCWVGAWRLTLCKREEQNLKPR